MAGEMTAKAAQRNKHTRRKRRKNGGEAGASSVTAVERERVGLYREALADSFAAFARQLMPPRLRSIGEFAEADVVIGHGRFAGYRFRCYRQPFTRLWFEEVASGRWTRFVITGPSQSSKTVIGWSIPLLYHLFEVGERVLAGIPDLGMAKQKWQRDLEPMIAASRYRELLPTKGIGSRGGSFDAIRFRNGAVLKFVTGAGDDKNRAEDTARVLIVTETDGLDRSGLESVEADKLTQMEARQRSWPETERRTYLECTLTTAQGRTWREITQGSDGRLFVRCPSCSKWVCPDRRHFRGWEDAETLVVAKRAARWHCPACDAAWSDEQRREANQEPRLVHKGQEIDGAGAVRGPLPATDTLGFRWGAVHNNLLSTADVAADCWRAKHDPNEDNAERKMCQIVFAEPYRPDIEDMTPLSPDRICGRTAGDKLRRGIVPAEYPYLSVGLDIGKRVCHWVALASRTDATSHIIDYGRFSVASDDLGVEQALILALRDFRDLLEAGWAQVDGQLRTPDTVWIDSNWAESRLTVYRFCMESNLRGHGTYLPTEGRGTTQQRSIYTPPRKINRTIKAIGDAYHLAKVVEPIVGTVMLVVIDADVWKSAVHQRLSCDPASTGAMTVFLAMPREHITFSRHLTGEKQIEEYVPGKGIILRWVRETRNVHWFDAAYLATAAAHYCGARLVESGQAPVMHEEATPALTMPDGRPFLVTGR